MQISNENLSPKQGNELRPPPEVMDKHDFSSLADASHQVDHSGEVFAEPIIGEAI